MYTRAMHTQRPLGRAFVWLIGIGFLIGTMGASCNLPFVSFPSGELVPGIRIGFGIVEIELINTTAYPVDPYLYVDPEELTFIDRVFSDPNLVQIDPPLVEPGEIVTLEFDCDDIGTAGTDRAELLVSSFEAFQSDNAPIVREEDHFECGDVISFIFTDDEAIGEFFTRVEVNGQFLMD